MQTGRRNNCTLCRYNRCLSAGMSKDGMLHAYTVQIIHNRCLSADMSKDGILYIHVLYRLQVLSMHIIYNQCFTYFSVYIEIVFIVLCTANTISNTKKCSCRKFFIVCLNFRLSRVTGNKFNTLKGGVIWRALQKHYSRTVLIKKVNSFSILTFLIAFLRNAKAFIKCNKSFLENFHYNYYKRNESKNLLTLLFVFGISFISAVISVRNLTI